MYQHLLSTPLALLYFTSEVSSAPYDPSLLNPVSQPRIPSSIADALSNAFLTVANSSNLVELTNDPKNEPSPQDRIGDQPNAQAAYYTAYGESKQDITNLLPSPSTTLNGANPINNLNTTSSTRKRSASKQKRNPVQSNPHNPTLNLTGTGLGPTSQQQSFTPPDDTIDVPDTSEVMYIWKGPSLDHTQLGFVTRFFVAQLEHIWQQGHNKDPDARIIGELVLEQTDPSDLEEFYWDVQDFTTARSGVLYSDALVHMNMIIDYSYFQGRNLTINDYLVENPGDPAGTYAMGSFKKGISPGNPGEY